MLPAFGHINCTFHFAKKLQEEGYHVIYYVPTSLKEVIQAQGYAVRTTRASAPKLLDLLQPSFLSKAEGVLHRAFDRLMHANRHFLDPIIEELNSTIAEVKPSLIFIDAFTPYTYFYINNRTIPVLLLQIMFDTRKRAGIPPLNSLTRPVLSIVRKQYIELLWVWYKLKTKLSRLISLEENDLSLLYHYSGINRKRVRRKLNFNYAFHPGIKDVEELVLAPQSLDYPEVYPSDTTIYLASSIHTQRKEYRKDDYRLKSVIREMKKSENEHQWIYCSLGTLNLSHNKSCKAFFEKVISICAKHSNWRLILATGEMPTQFFSELPNGIHVFKSVPQLEILGLCDLMITHGGINSMLECINTATPMLVYPLNNKWDQNGNAARIIYYQLGLAGNIKRDKLNSIERKMKVLLSNPNYRTNLINIQRKIKAEKGMDKGLEKVKALTGQAAW